MHPLLAFAFRGRHKTIRILLIAVLLSVPIVTLTSSDYLTLSTLRDIENDMLLVVQVSHTDLNLFLSSLESLQQNTDLRNVSALSFTFLHDTWLVAPEGATGTTIALIGLENWISPDDVVATDSYTARQLNLKLGDKVNLTDTENKFNKTYTLTTAPELTEYQNALITELEQSSLLTGESFGSRLYGSLPFLYSESLDILTKIELYPMVSVNLVVFAYLRQGITTGTFSQISDNVNSIVEYVTTSLSGVGNVKTLRDPRSRLESVRLAYDQLEWSLQTITLPSIAGCMVFLFVAAWIHFEGIATERHRLAARGVSKEQFVAANLLESAVIGGLGGLLSIPAGAFLSMIAFGFSPTEWITWSDILWQNPSFTIGITVILSVTISLIAAYEALKSLDVTRKAVLKTTSGIIGILVLLAVFTDITLGFPSLLFVRSLSSGIDNLTADFVINALALLELVMFVLTPVLAPLFVSRAYPSWNRPFRKVVSKLLKVDVLVTKSVTAKKTRRFRFVFLAMIIAFILSAPILAYSAHESMKSADQRLVIGGDLKVTLYGLNTTFSSRNLTSALSSIEGISTVAWAGELQVLAGFARPLLESSSLLVVSDEYFQLNMVREYFSEVPPSAILSESLAKTVESPSSVFVEISNNVAALNVSGFFQFAPGFHHSPLQFQKLDNAVLMTLAYYETQLGTLNTSTSQLVVDVQDGYRFNEVTAQVFSLLNTTIGDPSRFSITTFSSDALLGVEYRIAIAAQAFLVLVGTIALGFVISLDVRNLKPEATTLWLRGASHRQVIIGILIEEVGVLIPTFFFGLLTSFSYYYGLSIVFLLLLDSSITRLPQGYIIPIPMVLVVILLFLFITLAITTLIEVKRWSTVQYSRDVEVLAYRDADRTRS